MKKLHIENFGPIGKVDIELGDLTILVGPQASGKTIALETLKLAIDRASIIDRLTKGNYITSKIENILNVYYGRGSSAMWKEDSRIVVDDMALSQDLLSPNTEEEPKQESIFYIPAQRVTSVADGAGKNFDAYSIKTPYVNRQFADTVQRFVQNGIGQQTTLFPMNTRLKTHMRKRFDKSIYHGAKVVLVEDIDMTNQLVLVVDGMMLPVAAWSAGQREFTPLLLGFYCLTGAPQNVLRNDFYETVIIEEPEMGLHPKAIVDVLLQILVLIQGEKGPESKKRYNVIVSTHSPVFLEFAWAFNQLKDMADVTGKYNALYELLGVRDDSKMKEMLAGVFAKTIRTYYLGAEEGRGKAESQDISQLDIWSTNPIMEEWGGLSTFASEATDIVSQYTAI